MKGLAICQRGLENTACQEIRELLEIESDIAETAITFDVDINGLVKLAYRSQSLIRVLALISSFDISNDFDETVERINKAIASADFNTWLTDRTFKVFCQRTGPHCFSSQDLPPLVGELIIEKTRSKASMVNPQVQVLLYIYDLKAYLGIDIAGFDLSKRDYRVFPHPNALNSTVGYALVRLSGFSKGALLDPFCGSGTIPIEAALYLQGISPHKFKKEKFAFARYLNIDLSKFDEPKKPKANVKASDHLLKFLKVTKSHAKLAGVELDVTRMDIDWLDTKIEEKSIDCIVTHPPSESRLHDPKHIEKLYTEFFHQAEYILKDEGIITVCISRSDLFKLALKHFTIVSELLIWQGGQELSVLVLRKVYK